MLHAEEGVGRDRSGRPLFHVRYTGPARVSYDLGYHGCDAAGRPAAATGTGCRSRDPNRTPAPARARVRLPSELHALRAGRADLDCGQIGFAVRVTGPDEFGLDLDRDGRGCESYG